MDRIHAVFGCSALLASLSLTAQADKDHLDQCLQQAAAIKPGEFLKLEYLNPSHEGIPSYEIEIAGTDGREWEFLCDRRSGQIYEMEQEVDSASHELFTRHMKVDEKAAAATVLELYPGEIAEVEYEIEANGDASYEFDVVNQDGLELKVEVDAASGDIIEVHVEQWEIGEERDEKR